VLKTLARETGGHAFTAKRTEDVTRTFTQIARELRSGYTIAFLPPETSGGAFRSIYVDVNSPGSRQFIVRTRAGYYAAP
jgi:VWFA-related protein